MVRRNTEQQLDALIEPVRARVQQLESQMSTDPRDSLTAEYTKAKNMLNAFETIRDNRLREIDKMYGMAYTENQESRATWNKENRTKWRDQYVGGEAETADAAVSGGRRAAVQRGIFDEGNAGKSTEINTGGTESAGRVEGKTYQETGGSRSLETQNGRKYTFQAVSREGTTPKARSIADTLTLSGIRTHVYDGEVNTVDKNGKIYPCDADATTLSDGTVLVKNTAELPEKEIAAHEPIHHYRIARPDIYKPIADVVKYGGIDILNPDSAEVLNGIGNTYQTSHGSYLDLDNIIYYDIKIMI